MDARAWRAVAIAIVLVGSLGANYRTSNFLIQAGSDRLARQVGDEAERLRRDLAIQWLGRELPAWPQPCPIRVFAGARIPAHGATTYTPDPVKRLVRDFHMEIHGSPERLLDSVLPHEVTHTVLATHFGQPLPRWADEGASTTVEHRDERTRHEHMLREFLQTHRGLAMNVMFRMRDYPDDILPLYAQGYSVSSFLIGQGGHRKFVKFIEAYFQRGSWTHVVQEHYGYASLTELQDAWLDWVRAGSPPLDQYEGTLPNAEARNALVAAAPVVTPNREAPVTNSVGGDDGWYTRKRQQVAAREASSESPRQKTFYR